MADLAKAHSVVEESSLLIVLRNIVVMEVDHRLSHVGKIKLYTGEVCHHQGSFAEDLFIAHIADGWNDLYDIIFVKIIMLRTDDRMEHILDAVAVTPCRVKQTGIVYQAVVDLEIICLFKMRIEVA